MEGTRTMNLKDTIGDMTFFRVSYSPLPEPLNSDLDKWIECLERIGKELRQFILINYIYKDTGNTKVISIERLKRKLEELGL